MDRQGVPTEQLMTPDIVTVTSDTTIDEAVDTITENDIASLIVVDEDDHLSGVITNNDFVDFLADGEYGSDVTIDQFMTDEVITINADDSIQTAAARMITNSISHLPVVDGDGKTLGMLSTTDITAYSVSRA